MGRRELHATWQCLGRGSRPPTAVQPLLGWRRQPQGPGHEAKPAIAGARVIFNCLNPTSCQCMPSRCGVLLWVVRTRDRVGSGAGHKGSHPNFSSQAPGAVGVAQAGKVEALHLLLLLQQHA